MVIQKIKTDVVIIGAGSGGFGAAYKLATEGIDALIIDKNEGFGGTSVFAGVNCWEPGVSRQGVHQKLADILLNKYACSINRTVPNHNVEKDFYKKGFCPDLDFKKQDFSKFPFGLNVIVGGNYDETLFRSLKMGSFLEQRRFQFIPEEMSRAMMSLVSPYGNLKTAFNSVYLGCNREGDRITSIIFKSGNTEYEVSAKYFIDCSAEIALAKDAGCETSVGSEGKEKYGEPSSGPADPNGLNGVTYLFQAVRVKDRDHIDDIPDEYKCFDYGGWPGCVCQINVYPDSTLSVNMLPTMSGSEYVRLKDKADRICRARVYKCWNRLQHSGLRGWHLSRIFPMPGIREGHRLVGSYVLTEHDVRKGYKEQAKRDEFIAFADHALDIHGEGCLMRELEQPYGIPFSCTTASNCENLFVACRGASFSHVAASSCRLSRTMMSIGEGVGEIVSRLLKDNKIDWALVRDHLGIDRYIEYLDKAIERGKRL